MSQDTIIKPYDEPAVVFLFSATSGTLTGWTQFTKIQVDVGSESYNTVDDPANVVVDSDSELSLIIGSTTLLECGNYTPTIIGFDNGEYIGGIPLTSECKRLLESDIYVCEL